MTRSTGQPSQLLEGRRVWLDPQLDLHREFLYQLMIDPDGGVSVRFHGATPSPQDLEVALWDQVLAQFVVRGSESHAALGLVVLSSPNFVDRYCFFSMIAGVKAMQRGFVVEGAVLAIEYALSMWDFRKIYLDVLDSSLAYFGRSLRRYAQEEGRLCSHTFRGGRYHDVHKFAIYADTWRREARHLVAATRSVHPKNHTLMIND